MIENINVRRVFEEVGRITIGYNYKTVIDREVESCDLRKREVEVHLKMADLIAFKIINLNCCCIDFKSYHFVVLAHRIR